MIDPNLLPMIRCPITKLSLQVADAALIQQSNEAIQRGNLIDRGERRVEQVVDALLISQDGAWLYPVRGSIPTLIPDWAIAAEKITGHPSP